MAKGVYVGAPNFEPVTLPSGYTQLEYIQSSGTQYINTNFKPNGQSRIVMDCAPTSISSTFCFYCARSAASATVSDTNTLFFASNAYRGDYYGQSASTSGYYGANTRIVIDNNKGNIKIGNYSISNSPVSTSSPMPWILMASAKSSGSAVDTSSLGNYASMKLYSCKIYNNGTLVRDLVPAKNSSGTIGLYDIVNGAFYANAGSGTFTAGGTYAEVAHKAKKIYLGIDNVAHKVKKGYIGDANGIAQLFFSNVAKLTKYGAATNLSKSAHCLAASTVGNYAIFAGGFKASPLNTVNAYNSSLSKSNPTSLSASRFSLAGSTNGMYALFAGGRNTLLSNDIISSVDAYSPSLTRSSPTVLSVARTLLAAARAGNYALFAGGTEKGAWADEDQYSGLSTVDAYNQSLTRTTPTALSFSTYGLAGTSFNDYALFAGGHNADSTVYFWNSIVNYYNSSLTRGIATQLSKGSWRLAGAANEKYAMFAGGWNNTYIDTATAYDKSLTRIVPGALSAARSDLAATSIGEFILFAGGEGKSYQAVDVYDSSLTRTTSSNLRAEAAKLASATIGNYALFGGGHNLSSSISQYVDAYTLTYD